MPSAAHTVFNKYTGEIIDNYSKDQNQNINGYKSAVKDATGYQ